MTPLQEQAWLFPCQGEELVAVLSRPAAGTPMLKLGVLVVVGGPQYRVGSHRQFVLLARHLAGAGVACMRFDYRGMGDAGGAQRDFEGVTDDIRAAIDTFLQHVPELDGVVLWGLCDGASAALLYAPADERVRGLVLLNPWVRTEAGAAQVMLRHYYLRRLLSPAFWKKLLSGGVALGRAARELGQQVASVQEGAAETAGVPTTAANQRGRASLPTRLHAAWQALATSLPCGIILSGRDFVAQEFEQLAASSAWRDLRVMDAVERLAEADHTFSSAAWRDRVSELTLAWVRAWADQNHQPSGKE